MAAFSKQHYVKIAEILKAEQVRARVLAETAFDMEAAATTVTNITLAMAETFANDNPRFERSRFLDAAGL